jgi:hypothetical protein
VVNDQFDPGVLRALSEALDNAGVRVAELTASFRSSATAPDSAAVIGSADAAAGYASGLSGCLRGLDQLQASLLGLGQKLEVAAVHYRQNEAANTRAADAAGRQS